MMTFPTVTHHSFSISQHIATNIHKASYLSSNSSLTTGADLTYVDEHKKTILHHIVDIQESPDSLTMLELFSSKSEPGYINKLDKTQHSAMMNAAKSGRLQYVKILLKTPNIDVTSRTPVRENVQGVVNYSEQEGKSILDLIVRHGGQGCVDVLDQYLSLPGTHIDEPNHHGMTALHIGTESGKAEVMKLLVDRKANVDAQNKEGNTCLHFALSSNVLNTVMQWNPKMLPNIHGKTLPLHTSLELFSVPSQVIISFHLLIVYSFISFLI